MAIQFKAATKKESKLRMGIVGPSGTGKTYSALRVAKALGGRVVVMDSEHGSASKYADEFTFDVFEPDSFSPKVYIEFLREAAAAGYDVAIIDSLSHAWMGKDGALEMVDWAAKRNSGNSFAGWRDVTPLHNAMIEAILGARLHVIATMRSKTEYVVEEDSRGKKVPRKIGMQPVQRDGMEYEFDVVGDIDHDHNFIVTKTRCRTLKDAVIHEPGEEFGETLLKWLSDGEPLATSAQLNELRTLAAQKSGRAAELLEVRIAKGPTQTEAEGWLVALRADVAAGNEPVAGEDSTSSSSAAETEARAEANPTEGGGTTPTPTPGSTTTTSSPSTKSTTPTSATAEAEVQPMDDLSAEMDALFDTSDDPFAEA
ncbi:MAG TPA: ATP-binding protein [Longimicrobiaceae bacterium]|nr:ATP-binding protein [Longimicrobiaceae bacterium]